LRPRTDAKTLYGNAIVKSMAGRRRRDRGTLCPVKPSCFSSSILGKAMRQQHLHGRWVGGWFTVAGLSVLPWATAAGAVPAFSGADGAGAVATGGRGGVVYHVTLVDRNFSDNRPGSLRYGLNDANFRVNGVVQPRTIVFDVGGAFWLGRFGAERGHDNGWDSQSRLNLGSHVTLAGQTAPGGVYLMGGVVKAGGTNVIMRGVTLAPGYGLRNFARPEDGVLPTPGDFPDAHVYDALDISGQRMIFDQITAVYATDETISANESADDLTIQYSVIGQAQNYPQADAEAGNVRFTGHGLGSLFQMGSNANLSVHQNLYAHLKGRVPRVGTPANRLTTPGVGAFNDFRNNVFYNWYDTAGTGASGQPSQNNFVGNFYLAGPGGDDVTQTAGPDGVLGNADDVALITPKAGGVNLFNGSDGVRTGVFHRGNVKDLNKDGDADDAVPALDSDFRNSNLQSSAYTQTPYAGVTLDAAEAFDRVLAFAGAFGGRTAHQAGVVDVAARLIRETRDGTGRIVAWADDPFNADPAEGAEWRAMLALRADPTTGAAPFARPAGWDTDRDGMPDHWERAHGLDPFTHNPNGDFDADGYTDLEEYLNELAAVPAPVALRFDNGNGNGRYEEIGNWATGVWQPSRFDDVVIDAGAVTVDSVGQHAANVLIAGQGPDAASLAIHAGWLMVQQQLTIGGSAVAPGTLTLAGGELMVTALDKHASGAFVFTGGTLRAGAVGFVLINDGGTIAPGNSVGTLEVFGDLVMNGGALEVQIASPTAADLVIAAGAITLGGALEVALLDGFRPTEGQRWLIALGPSVRGTFASVTPGFRVEVDGGGVFVVAIPEPAGLAAGMVGALALRRRRGPGEARRSKTWPRQS
jgi:hypothetical protein